MDSARLRIAVRNAEHVLEDAAQEAERRYPDDPIARRIAEAGMLEGALKALVDAIRPLIPEEKERR